MIPTLSWARTQRVLLALLTAAPVLLAQVDPAKDDLARKEQAAAKLLRAAYERVYSAEARGLALFKAGDIEIVVMHDGGETEWEDGMLWKSGFAPVIEHERPLATPLRPASEELLMSMLGWGMGFEAWQRRFAKARFLQVGKATKEKATIRVRYEDGSHIDEVFSIEKGRIVTVSNGAFRTSFEYAENGGSLRLERVRRLAIAVGDPAIPDEIDMQFTVFRETAGVVVATQAKFKVVEGKEAIEFRSRLTKTRGNDRVPVADVAACYAAWAERALQRAYASVYSAEANGLQTLSAELHVATTVAGQKTEATTPVSWSAGEFQFAGDALHDGIAESMSRMLPFALGFAAWDRHFNAATFELQPTPDPQRRMRIAVGSGSWLRGAVATVEARRLTSFASAGRSMEVRYEATEGGLRVVGVRERQQGKVECHVAFSGFRVVNGVWLPSKMRVVLLGTGVEADVVLRGCVVNG